MNISNISENIRNGKLIALPQTMLLSEIELCDPDTIPLLLSFYGYLEPLKSLVSNKIDLNNIMNSDSDNAFLLACYGNKKHIVEYLISELNMNPRYCNIYGENGLMFAINSTTSTDTDFIQYLIDIGVNIKQTTIDTQNILHYLPVTSNSVQIAQLLYEKHYVDEFHYYSSDVNLLSYYCYKNNYDLLKFFIDKIENRHKFSSYFWAILNNNKSIFDLLMKSYPDTDINNLYEGNLNMFQIILNIFVNGNGDQSLAKWAIMNNVSKITNPKYVNNAGISSMIIATLTGNLQLVDYLFNVYDFKLIQRNKLFNNMYTIAMSNEAYGTIKYLALHGLYMENENLQYAVYKNNRFYTDIYNMYFNFINNINVLMCSENKKQIHVLHSSSYPTEIETMEIENDFECVICREKFIHLDDVIMCCNKHTYHPHCMLLQANDKFIGYMDCLVCFKEFITRPNNMYIYYEAPTTETINTYQKNNNLINNNYEVSKYETTPFTILEVPKSIIPYLMYNDSYDSYLKSYNTISDLKDNLNINYKKKDFFWYTTFNYSVDDINDNNPETTEDHEDPEEYTNVDEEEVIYSRNDEPSEDTVSKMDKLIIKLNDPYLKDMMDKRIMEYFILKKRNNYKKCYS